MYPNLTAMMLGLLLLPFSPNSQVLQVRAVAGLANHHSGLGYGLGDPDRPYRNLLFFNAGFAYDHFKGDYKNDSMEFVQTYNPSVGWKLSTGWETIKNGSSGFGFGLFPDYDYNTADRDFIRVHRRGTYLGRLPPTGDLEIPDYSYTLNLAVSYGFAFH